MTTLIKDTNITYVPGTPGSAGIPPTPGAPERPAQCVTTYANVFVPTYSATIDPLTGVFPIVGWRMVSVPTTTCTPATPAVPPTPGTPAKPATAAQINKDYQLGWNSGAIGIAQLAGDGAFHFSVPASVVGVVVGLATTDPDTNYKAIQFGIHLASGLARVMESGSNQGGLVGFSAADVFSIQRVGADISYYRNDVLIYTSAAPSAGALLPGVVLYSGGDAVIGAKLTDIALGLTGGGATRMAPLATLGFADHMNGGRVALAPLAVFAAEAEAAGGAVRLASFQALGGHAADWNVAGALAPLSSIARMHAGIVAHVGLAGLQTIGANGTYSAGRVALALLKVHADVGIIPTHALGASSMAYLLSAGHGYTGTAGSGAVALRPLRALGAEREYGESAAALVPLTAAGGPNTILNGYALLRNPKPGRLTASSTQRAPNAFHGSIKGTLAAYSGGFAKLKAKPGRILATGTGVVIGRSYLSASAGALRASGTAGTIGGARLVQPGRQKITAYSGAVVSIRVGGQHKVVASGGADGVARAMMRMPLCRLVASGGPALSGVARLVGPALRPVPNGRAYLIKPGYTLVAYGSAVVAVEYEAYAINLQPGADTPHQVTRYTNFPFNQIVRFGDAYYGVADDGLHLLEGDTDAGAPIPWTFRTCLTDFQSRQLKRVRSMFIGGRLAKQVDATLVVGEQGENTYHYRALGGPAAQNSRVVFGKGVRSRYYAFGLADATGSAMEIDAIDLETEELTRGI